MKNKSTIELICGIMILLFVYAAVSKLITYAGFTAQLKSSPFIGNHASLIAVVLPVLELVIVLMLCFEITRKVGMYCFLFLMILFTGYIAAMLWSGVKLPCSCGGVLKKLSWKQHLLFNFFFIVLAVWGILLDKKSKQWPGCK